MIAVFVSDIDNAPNHTVWSPVSLKTNPEPEKLNKTTPKQRLRQKGERVDRSWRLIGFSRNSTFSLLTRKFSDIEVNKIATTCTRYVQREVQKN